MDEQQNPPADRATSSMGAIALMLFLLGILGPLTLELFRGSLPIHEEQVPLIAIACEGLALVLGIASWRDLRGRVAAIGAGAIAVLAVFAYLQFTATRERLVKDAHERMERDREEQERMERERRR
jgi:hypothetical protein